MMKHPVMMSALLSALSLSAGLAPAADPVPAQGSAQEQGTPVVHGSQMMTRQERTEYRARLRSAKTAEEREQIRQEHHERMKERARERGLTLPDMPPAGGGMGSGGGMGPGGGSNR